MTTFIKYEPFFEEPIIAQAEGGGGDVWAEGAAAQDHGPGDPEPGLQQPAEEEGGWGEEAGREPGGLQEEGGRGSDRAQRVPAQVGHDAFWGHYVVNMSQNWHDTSLL